MIRKVRVTRRRDPEKLSGDLHPLAARVLAMRGQIGAPDYGLGRMLGPSLSGLGQATEILAAAVQAGDRILVVGDFDADGATGTALAVRALTAMGARDVCWKVPDRFLHGYGLGPALVDECLKLEPRVIVTVDQGISSIAGVAKARQAGVRVVVTDHHLPGNELPEADAIVNPALPGDRFPSKSLAGVGVVFYTLAALRGRLRELGWFDSRREPRMDTWLDLVALGTVADLVALDENNRILVHQGLKRIAGGHCVPGIQALLEVAGRNPRNVTAADLGFFVGPRLNAAGRLEDMSVGIECLLCDRADPARAIARRLDELNRNRQGIQAEMQAQAEVRVEATMEKIDGPVSGLCIFDDQWHAGVVGLVASRLKDRLQRPIIAMAPAEEGSREIKGSGRSPVGVHMRDLLVDIDTCNPGLIDRFGGHARAAGLSLDRARVEAFQAAFDAALEGREFAPERIESDGEVPPELFSVESALALVEAGPWGQGWPEPLFDGRFRILHRSVVGSHHLKLRLEPDSGGPEVEAIAFRAGAWLSRDLPEPLHVTFRLEVNRWMGRSTVQLNIQHLVEGVDYK